MNPLIVANKKREYFACPVCESVIMMGWDKNEHKVIYPEKCSECGQDLKWSKKLIDLSSNNKKEDYSYLINGYFSKFTKREGTNKNEQL